MSTNSSFIKTQSLVTNQFAFSWLKQPGLSEKVNWSSSAAKKIGSVNRTGASATILRPPRASASITGLSARNSILPGAVGADITYQAINDAYIPLTVNRTIELNLQTSIEELTLNRSPEDIKQYIDSYVTILRNKVEQDVSDIAYASVGTVIELGTGEDTYAGNFLLALGEARAHMINVGATTSSNRDLYALIHPNVSPKVGASTVKAYNFGNSIGSDQITGKVPNLANFDIYESPLMSPMALLAQWSGVTSTANVGYDGATAISGSPTDSGYVETMTIPLTGLIANTPIAKGTVITSSVAGNWINPDTGADLGKQVSFVVQSSVTASAGGVATVTVKQALIVSGPYRNGTRTTQIPSGSTFTVVGAASGAASTKYPCLALTSDAVVGVSPDIILPSTVKLVKMFNFNGIKMAMIEDHFPGTVQGILKIIGFYGLTVQKPEGAVAIYGA